MAAWVATAIYACCYPVREDMTLGDISAAHFCLFNHFSAETQSEERKTRAETILEESRDDQVRRGNWWTSPFGTGTKTSKNPQRQRLSLSTDPLNFPTSSLCCIALLHPSHLLVSLDTSQPQILTDPRLRLATSGLLLLLTLRLLLPEPPPFPRFSSPARSLDRLCFHY